MSEGDVEQKVMVEAPVEAVMPEDTGEDEVFEENKKREESGDEGDSEKKSSSYGDDFDDISEEAKSLFHEYDIDKNGTLSSFELERALIELGLSPSKGEVKLIQSRYDENKDGEIDVNEFLKIVKDVQVLEEEQISEKNLIAAFKVFDASGNGFISVDEFKNALTENDDYDYDTDEIKEIMDDADYDDDGQLNYEEFVELMFKQNEEGGETSDEEEEEND